MLEFSTSFPARDWVAAVRYLRIRNPVFPLMIVLGLGMAELGSLRAPIETAGIIFIAIGIIVVWVQVFYVFLSPREEYKRSGLESIRWEFRLTDESIRTEVPGSTTESPWSVFRAAPEVHGVIILLPRRWKKFPPWIGAKSLMPEELARVVLIPTAEMEAPERQQLCELINSSMLTGSVAVDLSRRTTRL